MPDGAPSSRRARWAGAQGSVISMKARCLARPNKVEKNFNTVTCQPYLLSSACCARCMSAASSTRLPCPSAHPPRTWPRASQAAKRIRSFALSRFILTEVPLVTAYSLPSQAATQMGVGTSFPLRRKVTRLTYRSAASSSSDGAVILLKLRHDPFGEQTHRGEHVCVTGYAPGLEPAHQSSKAETLLQRGDLVGDILRLAHRAHDFIDLFVFDGAQPFAYPGEI